MYLPDALDSSAASTCARATSRTSQMRGVPCNAVPSATPCVCILPLSCWFDRDHTPRLKAARGHHCCIGKSMTCGYFLHRCVSWGIGKSSHLQESHAGPISTRGQHWPQHEVWQNSHKVQPMLLCSLPGFLLGQDLQCITLLSLTCHPRGFSSVTMIGCNPACTRISSIQITVQAHMIVQSPLWLRYAGHMWQDVRDCDG